MASKRLCLGQRPLPNWRELLREVLRGVRREPVDTLPELEREELELSKLLEGRLALELLRPGLV